MKCWRKQRAPTVPKSVTCESVRNKFFVQVLSLDVTHSHNRAGNISPLHLMTETDPVSVNMCLKELKITHYMKNNSHVYC
jgi:hypothetical protein